MPTSIYPVESRTRRGEREYCYTYIRYNEVDEAAGRRQPRRLLCLGRSDDLEEGAPRTLAELLRAFCRKGSQITMEQVKAALEEAAPAIQVICSKQFGLRWIIEQAWEELGYSEALQAIQQAEGASFAVERAVFAMVLQQIIEPGSKRRLVDEWLDEEVFFPEAEGLQLHQMYQALDVLEEFYPLVEARLRKALEDAGLSTKGLHVDTTTRYFEIRYDDVERGEIEEQRTSRIRRGVVNDPPLRMRGKSKDRRPDAPQVVLETMVGDHGLVLHHETHPGNSSDVTLTSQTIEWIELEGLEDKTLVGDSGMNSRASRDRAREASVTFVFGQANAEEWVVRKALKQRGPYVKHPQLPGLSYKAAEVEYKREKLLVVLRRDEGERERALRLIDRHVEHVKQALAQDDRAEGHSKRICDLLTHRSYRKYVRRSKRAKNRLILDREAIAAARRMAGVTAMSTCLKETDPAVVDGLYESLHLVEEGYKWLKSGGGARRPIRHRKATRIRAQNMLDVMALNIVRWLELKSGRSWRELKRVFRRLRVEELKVGAETAWQTVELDSTQAEILAELGYQAPPRRFHVQWA